jgi:hypothetical protein
METFFDHVLQRVHVRGSPDERERRNRGRIVWDKYDCSSPMIESRSTLHPKLKPLKPAHPSHHRSAALNTRPIIGILSLANSDNANETGSIIPAGYVKWLEQAGARVAVVPFNAPSNVLDSLFDGLNGLLSTGGGLSLDADTVYFQQALYLFNKSEAA